MFRTISYALLSKLVSTGATRLKRCVLSLYIFHRLIVDAQSSKWRDSLIHVSYSHVDKKSFGQN